MLSLPSRRWLAAFLVIAISSLTITSNVSAAPAVDLNDDSADYAPFTRSQRQEDLDQFTVPLKTMDDAVVCPRGIKGRKGGVVLLIHGTGSSSLQSWSGMSPWLKMLPDAGPGFDVCYIDLPNYSYTDLQFTGEYVARAIMTHAPKSATGKVSLVGHSQGGGANPQWGIAFWPTTRSQVHAYVSIAGDFHGLALPQLDIGGGLPIVGPLLNPLPPAFYQQLGESHYMAAQNKIGGQALVPTTSIWTVLLDDVLIGNDLILMDSSNLPGALNVKLQDLNVCGPLFVADHFTSLTAPATLWLAISAMASPGGQANLDDFSFDKCFTYPDGSPSYNISQTIDLYKQVFNGTSIAPYNGPGEPMLKPYVCKYNATDLDCAKEGFYTLLDLPVLANLEAALKELGKYAKDWAHAKKALTSLTRMPTAPPKAVASVAADPAASAAASSAAAASARAAARQTPSA